MKRHHLEKNDPEKFLNEPAPNIYLKRQDLQLHASQDDQLMILILIVNVLRLSELARNWNKRNEFLFRRRLLPDLRAHRQSPLLRGN